MRKAVCPVVAGCLGLVLTALGAGMKDQGQADRAVRKLSVEQLIDHLGHRSYRIRQAAQRALARLDANLLPALVRARKTRKDLEVIHRLDLVIPQLERSAMLRPKLVTLHVDKQPIQNILAEISKQTGYPIDTDNNPNNNLFTFHLDRVPFWQALDRVCKEARLALYPYYYGSGYDRLRLVTYSNPPGPYVQYNETFRMVATSFNYNRNITFNGSFEKAKIEPQRTEYLAFNFTLHTEPKLPFLLVNTPVVTEAYDEMKRSMAPALNQSNYNNYDRSRYSRYGSGSRSFYNSMSASLVRPSRDSKMARLIRGHIPVVLLGKQDPIITVDRPLAVKKQKFAHGRTTMELEEVIPTNNWNNGKMYQAKMTLKETTDLTQIDYTWSNSLQYRLELMDDKGNKYIVWSNSLYNKGPRQVQGTITFRPPDNVAVGAPVKLVYYEWHPVQHKVRFEFKDLPLP
jgi:hypothetical protein